MCYNQAWEVIFVSENNGTVLVMYAPLIDTDISAPLVPVEREREVRVTKNETVRREKYLVWKLLARAAKDRFNLDFANLEFTKIENGKWVSPGFYFSLSHSDGALCVAVSEREVGVDIQRVRQTSEGLAERFLTGGEKSYMAQLSTEDRGRFFIEAWAKKESIFKKTGGSSLDPRAIDTLTSDAVTAFVTLGTEEYVIALAMNENEKYEIIYTEEI